MKKFLQTKFKNASTLISLIMMVVLVFPGATIDNQFDPSAESPSDTTQLQGENLGQGGFCDSNPQTDTTATAWMYADYNGQQINNGASEHNGQTTPPNAPNYATLTTFSGTQLHIVMTGTTSPGAAGGTVRATVTIGNQTVFDQTASSGANGADANFVYDTTLGSESVVVNVVATACNNVSTAGHTTYVAPNGGFDFSCGVDQIVNAGTNAYYPLHAYNMATAWQYQPIEVDVTSSPSGVDIPNLPLTYQNSHMWTAEIDTSSLTPNQQYTLTFSAQNPAPGSLPPVLCYANLTVSADVPTIDLKFNGSDGPTTPNPSNGDTGLLSWTTQNATECEADMVQGEYEPWNGAMPAANEKEETLTVKGLKIDNTYEFRLTCRSASGEQADDTVVVSVGEPKQPTGEFYCEGDLGGGQGQDTCSVSNGYSALLYWSTEYTKSCTLDPEIKDYTPGTNEKDGVSTGALNNPPSSVVYTLSCLGIGEIDKYEDTVTINIAVPIIHAQCAPSPLVLNQTGLPGVITVNVDVENQGSLETVQMSGQFQSPEPGNAPEVKYGENPFNVPGASSIILTPNKDSSLGTYIFEVTVSAEDINQGATPDTCYVTVIIEGEPPQPPVALSARADIHCESVTVNWENPKSGPTPEGFQVFRSLEKGKDEYYTPVGDIVPYVDKDHIYSFIDNNPLQMEVTNFYGVKSKLGTQYSSLVEAGGVVPSDCAPSISQSDKDLFGVDNNFSNPTKCNNTSDPFNLPNSGIFRDGAKVWFRINVCNTGTDVLTGIVVSEVGSLNLTQLQYEEDEKSKDCVVEAKGVEKIILKDLPGKDNLSDPDTVCSITISAILTKPNNSSTQLYRFWNQALITSNELDPKVVSTPQYLFSKGGTDAVPTRGENNR